MREALTQASRPREFPWSRADRIRLTGMVGRAGGSAGAGYTTERIFTVTSTVDAEDRVPGDGVCDAGESLYTLRAALTESNLSQDRTPSPTSIHFKRLLKRSSNRKPSEHQASYGGVNHRFAARLV